MHVFTYYSPSHQPFVDEFFRPSLQAVEPDLQIHTEIQDFNFGTGSLKNPGFTETITLKYTRFWEFASSRPFGDLILCSDCDIQFFRPFVKDLEGYMESNDLVFQTNTVNPPKFNVGFFCIRWLPSTRAFIINFLNAAARNLLEEKTTNNIVDQLVFPARISLLPPDDYWTVLSTGNREFTPEKVPHGLYMHHGNGRQTMADKLQLMRDVRDTVRARTSG
jgi:hypothetical protein